MMLQARRGFTLVETMVAIVMLMIVIGSLYGVFRGANRSISSTDEIADVYQTARILLIEMNRELCSACQMPGVKTSSLTGKNTEDGENAPQRDTLTFLTIAHSPVGEAAPAGDLCQVTYAVMSTPSDRPIGLFVDEDFYPGLDSEAKEQQQPTRLSKLVVGLNCKYLDGSTGEWRDKWVDQKEMPRAVRIELALKPERQGAKPIVVSSTANLLAKSAAGAPETTGKEPAGE